MNEGEVRVSKSELKRRALEAQALGRRLTQMSAHELTSIPLSEGLRQAVAEYHRMIKKEARRRQLQYLGRLMRDADQASIGAAVAALDHTSSQQKYRLKQLESWRERLLTDDRELAVYVSEHPGTDVKKLREILALHRRASSSSGERNESGDDKRGRKGGPDPKHVARKLYQFLQDNARASGGDAG